MASSDQVLKQVIAETLSPHADTRRAAESRLLELRKSPSHPLEVLKLVASLNDPADAPIRQASVVHFKNLVKKGWDVHAEDGTDGIVINDTDRITIKSHLVQLMCTTPPQIQSLLSESISLIAVVDYPQRWDNLLPELVQQFNSPDINVVIGVLKTANGIFKRFRYVERSDDLYRVILYTLQGIQEQLTKLFKTIGQAVQAMGNDKAALVPRFEALRLICRIFYSLNYQDLPEYFEDNMNDWMTDFAIYMDYKNPLLIDDDEDTEPSPIDKLQGAIIEVLDLYAGKDEEVFVQNYLAQFTTLVWNLLMNVTNLPKHDSLATKAIKFLSSLVEKLMHRQLFQDEATLRQIVLKIVIPNLTFRESDEERFEDDPHEYIVTEVEGSDSESRRKCSQDLLRAMCRQFEPETTSICSEHVGSMLTEYSANPDEKWAAKDAAIHLMMGIAIKRESSKGVSEVNPGVSVMDFFQTQILPELQDTHHTNRPVVKASAIKYVSVFRNQFSREDLVKIVPLLISHLASPVIVVHTFAAYAIERVLVSKQENSNISKIGSAELKSFIEPLFTGLFAIVDNASLNENAYVMKCVMRALASAGEDVIPVTQIVITKLTAALARVAKNPRNPQFNHFLFESIAVLVRSVCSKDPSAVVSMEPLLFEPFNFILREDIAEFTPYAFQILAQLLEYRPAASGIGQAFTELFGVLLTPILWEKKGNVPALARLLRAYILKAAPDLVPQLNPILGVFQKLLAAKATEVSAFEILNSSITHFPQEAIEPKIITILNLLMVRLQGGRTPRFERLLTTFLALFIGKFGAQVFFERTNSIQPGLGAMLLVQVWAPLLKSGPTFQKTDAKIQVVGVTKLLCESQVLFADDNSRKVWADALSGLMTVLTSSTFSKTTVVHVDDEPEIEIAYDAQFSRLMYASKEVEDPFPDLADPVAFFVHSLNTVLSNHSSQLLPLIQQNMDPKLAAGLESMFQQAGLRLG